MPYISTPRPEVVVTSENVPLALFRYSACRARGPDVVLPRAESRGHAFELISRMSSHPSPSASANAPPEPIVSGRYFLPAAPLEWRNLMPAAAVTSVNARPPAVMTPRLKAHGARTKAQCCAFMVALTSTP